MQRTLLAAIGLVMTLAGMAYGLGGNLEQPSISIPADGGKEDPVARKIFDVLWSHRKDFTGGSFINAQSELYFAGGVDGVNSLLADLAKVDGATLRVRLSKDAGLTRWMFPGKEALPHRPCDCRIDHNGWGDAHVITITLYVGGNRLDPDKLELPAIKGGELTADERR